VTPTLLQDHLVEVVKTVIGSMKLNNSKNENSIINVYPQYLPSKKGQNDRAHFPYVLVRIIDGEDSTEELPSLCKIVFIIGIHDDDTNFQGYKDKELLKTFVNTYLGEEWEDNEGEGADFERLYKRRETYNCQVPDDVLILTAGVDVQDDRLEIEVVGWGVGKESWGIQYKKIYGDLSQTHIWNELDSFLDSEFYYLDGTPVKTMCTCIDSGGHFTTEVYKFVKNKENRRIFAVKGKGGSGNPLVGKPSKNNREGVYLFSLGVDTGKEKIYSSLNVDEEGSSFCHFPFEEEKGYTLEYFKSLCAEKRIVQYQKGVSSFKWVQKYKRNEGLDLRNYATAALEILNPNFEQLLTFREKNNKSISQITQSKVNTAKKKKKRIVSKGIT